MPVEKSLQKSVKITPKAYNDLELLKHILTEFYRKKFSSDEALLWLFMMARDPIDKINKDLAERAFRLRQIENPLYSKNIFDEIRESRKQMEKEREEKSKAKTNKSNQNTKAGD